MNPDGSVQADLPAIKQGDVFGDQILIGITPSGDQPKVSNLTVEVCRKYKSNYYQQRCSCVCLSFRNIISLL